MLSPSPGKHWVHLTIGTYASWLPGDDRGWRSRDHKVHSSGHHRAPPPKGEHAGLRQYSQSVSDKAVVIPKHLRPKIGQKLIEQFKKLGHRLRVLSVGGQHVHVLIELPISRNAAKHEVGRCKQAAALLVAGMFKPRLWQKDCGIKPVEDGLHWGHVDRYIRDHINQGAWVWSADDGKIEVR